MTGKRDKILIFKLPTRPIGPFRAGFLTEWLIFPFPQNYDYTFDGLAAPFRAASRSTREIVTAIRSPGCAKSTACSDICHAGKHGDKI